MTLAPPSDSRMPPGKEIGSDQGVTSKTVQSPTGEAPTQTSPRALAALSLIDQGRALVKANKPDEAIMVLEKAMSLHPQNGKVYYFLASAWLLKGDVGQAETFNRLAENYLRTEPEWQGRINQQKKKIQLR